MMTWLAFLITAAEGWRSYMIPAAWQSALVGVLLIGVVHSIRRAPAPLRYGLLLVALIKFAIPPLLVVSYAANTRVSELQLPGPAVSLVSPTENAGMDSATALWTPVPAQIIKEDPEGYRSLAPPAVNISPVSISPSLATDASTFSMMETIREYGWTLLLVFHLVGALFVLFYLGIAIMRTWRFVASCNPVTDHAVLRVFQELQRRLGIRRRIRLLTTETPSEPMAMGVLRPAVVIPTPLIESLSSAQLEAVLAHELAHHRRGDLWLLQFENALLALWWFHPVLWLVRHTLRGVREDCCDDLLIASGITGGERYCVTLLEAAGHIQTPRWAHAALGIAEHVHPLGRRLRRIMDVSIRRTPRLSKASLALLLALALILVPGVRLVEGKSLEAVSDEGLAAYYPFNGTAQDESSNKNHGIVYGATPAADRSGTENAAYRFDGVDDYIEIPNSSTIDIHGNTSLTIGAWINISTEAVSARSDKAIVWKWGPRMEEDDQFVLAVSGGIGYFGLSDRASRIMTSPLPAGHWFSLAGVYDAENHSIQVYVNGELDSSRRLTSPIRDTSVPLFIGKGEVPGQHFCGEIDEIRLYNRALSPDEVRAFYQGPSYEERMKQVAASGMPSSAPMNQNPPKANPDVLAEAEKEIQAHYTKADPEVQEYIRWTAQTFTRGGLWQPANAYDKLSAVDREKKILYLVEVLKSDYGRHLCQALAEAGALQDKRLLPGLIKAAAFHLDDIDYDCRPKWMAVSALGRQDDESAVPVLIPLVDHGNQNTRMWARASLARLTGHYFGEDKQAWGKWWNEAGKQPPIDLSQLKPWVSPVPAQAAHVEKQEAGPMPVYDPNAFQAPCLFQGEYRHRSGGNEYEQPMRLTLYQSENGVITAVADSSAMTSTPQNITVVQGDEAHRLISSDTYGGEYAFQVTVDGTNAGMKRWGIPDRSGAITQEVPPGSVYDPNSRPDTYCAANILLRYYNVQPGEVKEFQVFDTDNSGDAFAAYSIRVEHKGKEEVLVPAGTFVANHLVLTQTSSANTWFKKREGHVTDFWVLDNGVIVRILRHREPYEMLLEKWDTPQELPGLKERGLPEALSNAAQRPPGEGCLWFGGDGDYVEIPNDPDFEVKEAFTWEAWVNFQPGGGSNPRIISKGWDFGENGYEFATLGTGAKRPLYFGVAPRQIVCSSFSIPAGEWHHVAAVYDGKQRYLYLNGQCIHTETYSGTWPVNRSPLALGRNSFNGEDAFLGAIDEVRVWSVARTEDELREAMNRKLEGNEPGLVAYWDFEDGSGQILTDRSGHGHHGQLGAANGEDPNDPVWMPPDNVKIMAISMTDANRPGNIAAQNQTAAYTEPWAVEAELFAGLIQGENIAVESAEALSGQWSGGKGLMLRPEGPATYTIIAPVPANLARTYTLFVFCSAAPCNGLWEVWLNGERVTQNDLYRPESPARVSIEAPVTLVPGINNIELKVIDKNPASTGYAIAIDCLGLRG